MKKGNTKKTAKTAKGEQEERKVAEEEHKEGPQLPIFPELVGKYSVKRELGRGIGAR